ncbi:isoprenylcysteine carboxylmethyltransferase family protein, partial [bacterium]|nr:isoprenylcysteine carboxylmethyltransferase family protein [bacterium]
AIHSEHGQSQLQPRACLPTPNERAALVQTGLYARIRHPIYTGVLITGIGAALAHGHIIILAIAAILAIFFTVKARYEESLLGVVYPEYADYRQRTGRFLPPLLRK